MLRHGLGAFDSVTFKPEEAERPDWPQMATDPKITRCDSHRFVYRLPRAGLKPHLGKTVMYRCAPRALLERLKMGSGMPLHRWLRGPRRGWAEQRLAPLRVQVEGLIETPIGQVWNEHLNSTWYRQ